jgi:hypothetical protein
VKTSTLTETFLDECPNCGAARKGEEETCRYCGSSMVVRSRVTETTDAENAPALTADSLRDSMGPKPDIVSEIKPMPKGLAVVLLILFVLCTAGAVAIVITGRENIASEKRFYQGLREEYQQFAFLGIGDSLYEEPNYTVMWAQVCGAAGIVLLIGCVALFPVLRRFVIRHYGTECEAEVISVTSGYDDTVKFHWTREQLPEYEKKMLVKTLLGGKDTTILLMASDEAAEKYTKGSHVRIRGIGKSFLVCE